MHWRRPRLGLLTAAALVVAGGALVVFAASRLGPSLGLWGTILEIAAALGIIASVIVVPLLLYVGFFIPARGDEAAWRDAVDLYRAQRTLKALQPDNEAVSRTLESLNDRQLVVAAILPDHSAAGREAARMEMARRGVTTRPAAISVPSFFEPGDLPDAERRVFGRTAKVRGVVWLIGAALLLLAFVLIGWNVVESDIAIGRALAEDRVSPAEAEMYSGGSVEETPPQLRQGAAFERLRQRETASLWLMGGAVPCVIVFFLSSWFRDRPVRVLLLRKFNERALGKAYRRLTENELAPFGHVIALSDRHVRRKFVLWLVTMIPLTLPALLLLPFKLPILLVLRMTDRTRWGPAFVASARDYRLLARRLHDRFELNLEVMMAASSYLVRTTDPWWKEVVQLFMTSADVIVLDISQVTEGTSWEIEAIARQGLWDRVVMVANAGHPEAAEETLGDLAERPDSINAPGFAHVYEGSGLLVDQAAFRADMFAALRRSVKARARAAGSVP